MSNINDPTGVKALLDQLRVSQAWKDAVASQENKPSPSALEERSGSLTKSANIHSHPESSSRSVAALLSQLQSSPWPPSQSTSNDVIIIPPIPQQAPEIPSSSTTPAKAPPDPKALTFQQALPLLAQLADDPKFVEIVTQLKQEQETLERRLWEDRRDIFRKYEEKVKVATTKATMIGDSSISRHEADMFQEGLKKSLEKFDRERALVAWDGLIFKQQAILSKHNVPTMFSPAEPADRERQQRVMDVIEGILRP